MTSYINSKKPFKYSHLDRRFGSNYIISTKENYNDFAYDQIPNTLCYILLKHLPLEIIGMIWNIKVIREDADFCEYIKILRSPIKPVVGIRLRSGRKLFMNTTHLGVFCNSITTYVFDKNIKNTTKIDMLHSTFLRWYEYLKINIELDSCSNLLNAMVTKIKEFTREAAIKSFEKKNDVWDNEMQRDGIILKLDDCMYYIDNFMCITSYEPCECCKKFDEYVNLNKYSKKKSFVEYFPQFDDSDFPQDQFWVHNANNYLLPAQADNWGNEDYPYGYG
jgi:hypothetical protein